MVLELRFIDPAFRCEVAISGTSQALYEEARPQFERLKGIKSLGLMAHAEEDIAMHTRHQHLVGLMRIFNKLSQQPKSKGLPKEFLWSFWCRLCFAQTGHAAMSYDSEKALLIACHLDSDIKEMLQTLLQPVTDKLTACPICKRQCPIRDQGVAEANEWFKKLILENQWQRIHLWIAALKIINQPKLLQILNQQIVGANNHLGFSEAEAFKMLCAPECAWNGSFQNLRRLDFIVRDLSFAGTLGIQLDVDNLVASADESHPDWRLLRSLSNYMLDTLYETLPAQTTSTLFQRALAAFLIKGKITTEMLFGIDLDQALDDDKLRIELGKHPAGREVFDHNRRRSWRAWTINTYIDENALPCDVERSITGRNRKYLSSHTKSYTACFKLQKSHSLAIAISHDSLASRPHAANFVKLCRSILNKQYPKLNPEQLTNALFDGLINRRCQDGLESVTDRLSKLPVDRPILQSAADVANRLACKGSETLGDIGFKIGEYEYPFHGNPHEIQINMMHAALSGDDSVRKNLDLSIEEAAKLLWKELTLWQTVYFGANPTKEILDLLNGAQDHLSNQVYSGGKTAADDLELFTLLEALKHPDIGVSFRVALPNLKLLKEDKKFENEYDVVSIVLNRNEVEVWIWGVTTETNLERKRIEDLAKIQKLKDLLGGRWEEDVRVVTCYVHKDENSICYEIDGRQGRRMSTSKSWV